MKHFAILLLLCIIFSCSHAPKNVNALYLELMNDSPPSSIKNLKGEGRIAIPNFMSWGLFNYICDSTYVKYLLNFKKYFENNSFNKAFEISKVNEFPNDLSYWTTNIKQSYETKFDKKNCIALHGINFPLIHDILIDTITFKTLHLVSAMRD